MEPVKIGLFLKELRKERGLTQEQLGELLHVSGRTVSRWETGVNVPDLDVLLALSELYGVDVRELMEGCRREKADDDGQLLPKVAEYSKERQQRQLRLQQLAMTAVSGVIALGVSFMTCLTMIREVSGGGNILLFTVLGYLIYCGAMYAVRDNRTPAGYLVVALNGFLAVIVSNIIVVLMHLSDREIRDTYFTFHEMEVSLGVLIAAYLAASGFTWLINRK